MQSTVIYECRTTTVHKKALKIIILSIVIAGRYELLANWYNDDERKKILIKLFHPPHTSFY